jgi:hypothetical protein
VSVFTDDELTNIEYAINMLLVEMQKDALSAIIYEGREFALQVKNKMEEFEELLEKVRKM